MITLQKDVKRFFFDRKAVVDAMGRATVRALSKAGAFVRTRAKSSMWRRKAVSSPGQPPSAHTGLLRDRLFFAYDPANRTVVVGPERIGSAGPPGLLEFGGSSTLKGKPVRYRPRPFMAPALDAELAAGAVPQQWSNSLRS